MTNVLHLISTTGPGGAETVFVDLATALNSRRWRSVAVIPGKGWVYDALVAKGLVPIVTPVRGAFDLRYLIGLCRVIRQHRIELIQTHLLGAGLYGSLAGLLCGVPVVSTFHGQPDVMGTGRWRAVKFRIIGRGASRIVFVSNSLRRFFLSLSGLNDRNTAVIPNGIDDYVFAPRRDTSLRAELGVTDQEFLVGAVGNVRPAKGYDVFLHAAAILQRQHAQAYRFVIVGEAHGALHESLLALRDRLGLRERVTFAGFRDAMHQVVNNLDVCVSTSHSEGFSLCLAEAMACGIPVVATKSGGPEEIIRDEHDGLLVDVGKPELIAAAIERLASEPALRQRLARNAGESVRARYTLRRMFAAYEGLYEACLCSDRVPIAPGAAVLRSERR